MAKTSAAKCLACGEACKKDELRLRYRLKVSMAMSDNRSLHPACAPRLPADTREVDVLALRHMLALADLDAHKILILETVLASLLT